MLQLVQFVLPNRTGADEQRELVGWNVYFSFNHPDRPDRLVPQDDAVELDDEADPELVEALSALYWFRRQEPLEDEE